MLSEDSKLSWLAIFFKSSASRLDSLPRACLDYDRAVGAGVTVVPLLVETFGGCAPPLMSALQRAAQGLASYVRTGFPG